MRLPKDTSERTARDFSMLGDYRCDKAAGCIFCKLYVTAGLSGLIESGFLEFASEFTVRDRLHAAISSSK